MYTKNITTILYQVVVESHQNVWKNAKSEYESNQYRSVLSCVALEIQVTIDALGRRKYTRAY